ncbi:N-acetyltransferase [Gemella sp. GH3]|uniref:N-acetyltransferase n=1 Tax=unclassified Gemella TaxID=2624949 RepID=UPI0015CF9520|nr:MULTISPECIES: N-acetyltransferase [unclassified Gemella]MBF0714144.1 N-acetyltransferase [Gemella sp. GH3.1]NYS51096.1 N-acetyltransferase [Gemella sp. GH3]
MIRLAREEDIEKILKIYTIARCFMRKNNNRSQWVNNYPSKELLIEDISRNQLYVQCDNDDIYGVFAFIIGEDITYNFIEGNWLNNDVYGTIHRTASDGTRKNVMRDCINFCKLQIDNLRIDTHKDNGLMQELILKNNFKYCGIIYVSDGSPRLAYHYEK